MILASVFGLALLVTQADGPVSTAPSTPAQSPTHVERGEPLPPGAPSEPYELTSWCYGALGEYLTVYRQVIPDLQEIDRRFGTPVQEAEPYTADVAAARQALERFALAMGAAERAAPQPIATRGAAAIRQGRNIWAVAKQGTRRQLARAWLYWGVPDRCDEVARDLLTASGGRAGGPASGAIALAPLTEAAPTAGPPPGAIMPPTFAAPAAQPEVGAPLERPMATSRDAAVASAPPAPVRPSRIVEEAAAPPAARRQPAAAADPAPVAPPEPAAASPASPTASAPPSDQAAEPVL